LRPLAERIGRACGSRAFDRPLTGPIEAAHPCGRARGCRSDAPAADG
jgi:hypothetical protein